MRLRDVTRAVAALQRSLPKVTRPLAELRVMSDGQRVIVRYAGRDATSRSPGRCCSTSKSRTLRDDVVRVLRPAAGKERSKTAYNLYVRASQLDEDPGTMKEAEALYRQALDLDPWLAIAYTNLGNICFRKGEEADAEKLYRRALEIDGRQPEAQYNLGYIMLERGKAVDAIPYFLGAIEADPALRRRVLQSGHGLRGDRRRGQGAPVLEAATWSSSLRGLGPRSPASTCRPRGAVLGAPRLGSRFGAEPAMLKRRQVRPDVGEVFPIERP